MNTRRDDHRTAEPRREPALCTPAEIIDRLIAHHGEGGLAPTGAEWQAIFALEPGPIRILNLLKFRESVETPNGTTPGGTLYARYIAGNAHAFARAGGKRLFFGAVALQFGLDSPADWDSAILTEYPNAAALAQMWLDPEFASAHGNRADGVERSKVLVFAAG